MAKKDRIIGALANKNKTIKEVETARFEFPKEVIKPKEEKPKK